MKHTFHRIRFVFPYALDMQEKETLLANLDATGERAREMIKDVRRKIDDNIALSIAARMSGMNKALLEAAKGKLIQLESNFSTYVRTEEVNPKTFDLLTGEACSTLSENVETEFIWESFAVGAGHGHDAKFKEGD